MSRSPRIIDLRSDAELAGAEARAREQASPWRSCCETLQSWAAEPSSPGPPASAARCETATLITRAGQITLSGVTVSGGQSPNTLYIEAMRAVGMKPVFDALQAGLQELELRAAGAVWSGDGVLSAAGVSVHTNGTQVVDGIVIQMMSMARDS